MQHDAIDWQMSLQKSPRRGLQWKFGAFTFSCRTDKCTQERNSAKNFLGTNSEYVQFQVFKRTGKNHRGMVKKASVGNSALQEENRSITSLESFLSQLWPRKWQTSARRSRAVTVKGATRPMGSNTLATKLRTNCITAINRSAATYS